VLIQFLANDTDFEKLLNEFLIKLLKCSFDSMKMDDIARFMLFQMNSIGLRSGEYGGRNTKISCSTSAFSIVSFA